jgi:hypothetical protein
MKLNERGEDTKVHLFRGGDGRQVGDADPHDPFGVLPEHGKNLRKEDKGSNGASSSGGDDGRATVMMVR